MTTLRVVAARLLHHLVDDELRVTTYVEALDAKLDGDAEATEVGLVVAEPPKLIRLKCANHHPKVNPG